MLRLIGAAAVLALAMANPAFAQGKGDGESRGKGNGGDHAAMGHDKGKPDKGRDDDRNDDRDDDRDDDRSVSRGSDRDRGDGERRDVRILRDRDARPALVERIVVGERDRIFASVPGCPPGLAKKNNGCLPPGVAKNDRDRNFGYEYRPALFGIPLRTRADYVYYDGYLIPAGGGAGQSYIPLLGGALAVGHIWPQAYPSMRFAEWQSDYYGFEDDRDYRYADNVVYRVDPETSAIESVVALLTGNDFTVGEQMPTGYDVYNVPGPYQAQYVDSEDALYRYADGRVYEVDPVTMLIAKAIDLIV